MDSLESVITTAIYLNQLINTHFIAHLPFKLVAKEAAVNSSIAGLDVRTEDFAIFSACVE